MRELHFIGSDSSGLRSPPFQCINSGLNQMSRAIAISIQHVCKRYTLKHKSNGEAYSTLRDVITKQAVAPFRAVGRKLRMWSSSKVSRSQIVTNHPAKSSEETFWALKDVSLEIAEGDVVGIIGRNGAGKSTLLKILSRITEPTEGRIRITGRVGSLLEVGTGFHPELTGRENIYLNGGILGMSRAETKAKFDEIVAFAEVEKFLDTPVKRFSSGMYVRLAFAVAAHLEPEILIVDEVLAVGDAAFQKRCLAKLHDAATGGRTVLFVSHNMHAISVLCNRGLFLDGGTVAFAGHTKETIEAYLSSCSKAEGNDELPDRRPGSGEYRFTFARPTRDYIGGGEEKTVDFEIRRRRDVFDRMFLAARIVDSTGTIIAECDSRLVGTWIEDRERIAGQFRLSTPWLKPGSYRVDLFICTLSLIVDIWESACWLEISPILPYPNSELHGTQENGVVFGDFAWHTEECEEDAGLASGERRNGDQDLKVIGDSLSY
jgi:lipopolysaccharide transport system ATP-binding protein